MRGINTLENACGFVTYKIDGDMVHIIDFFVRPELRTGKARRELFAQIVEIVKPLGVTKALGQVEVPAKDSTRKLAFWLTMGAAVFKTGNNIIYLIKEL